MKLIGFGNFFVISDNEQTEVIGVIVNGKIVDYYGSFQKGDKDLQIFDPVTRYEMETEEESKFSTKLPFNDSEETRERFLEINTEEELIEDFPEYFI